MTEVQLGLLLYAAVRCKWDGIEGLGKLSSVAFLQTGASN
jgi:hypothetical protein